MIGEDLHQIDPLEVLRHDAPDLQKIRSLIANACAVGKISALDTCRRRHQHHILLYTGITAGQTIYIVSGKSHLAGIRFCRFLHHPAVLTAINPVPVIPAYILVDQACTGSN